MRRRPRKLESIHLWLVVECGKVLGFAPRSGGNRMYRRGGGSAVASTLGLHVRCAGALAVTSMLDKQRLLGKSSLWEANLQFYLHFFFFALILAAVMLAVHM